MFYVFCYRYKQRYDAEVSRWPASRRIEPSVSSGPAQKYAADIPEGKYRSPALENINPCGEPICPVRFKKSFLISCSGSVLEDRALRQISR